MKNFWIPGILGMTLISCGGNAPAAAPPPVAPPAAEAPAPAEEPALEKGTVTSAESGKIIADFESIGKLNNVGGAYDMWASEAPKGMASVEVVPEGEGTGSALKITYDISRREGSNGAYSGIWMNLEGFDASTSKNLVMSVKAANGAGPKFFVELKCGENNKFVARAEARNIGSAWTKIEIPLVEFKEITDWKKLTQMAIVFDQNISSVAKGAYFIDNIRFE
ncbi:MAG: carbohydrate binding domain-containing protein [Candidatus Hydrogenedentota bacterium]